MMRCDHCQSLLLDHLYGLLDPAETAAVEDHLASCAGCASARDQAARLQGLISQAAKTQFPQVRFVAPSGAEAQPELPPTVTLPAPEVVVAPAAETAPREPRRAGAAVAIWARWVVAASVLAALPAALLLAHRGNTRLDTARRDTLTTAESIRTARLAELDRARQGAMMPPDGGAGLAGPELLAIPPRVVPDVQEEEQSLPLALARAKAVLRAREACERILRDWTKAEEAALREPADSRPGLRVEKFATAQPGAPNRFAITIEDRGDQFRSAPLEALVRDQNDVVLFRQTIDPVRSRGTQEIVLPADIWAKINPDTELYLSVAAVDEKTRARTELQERIPLLGPVYATHLVTDKPTYRPGETLFFRSLTLDRVTFRPPTRDLHLHYDLRSKSGRPVPGSDVEGATPPVRIVAGKAEPVTGPDGVPVRGVGCGEIRLPASLPDGDYLLTLTELPGPAGGAPVVPFPVTRMLKVRAGGPEQYQKQLGFAAASFAPGETVEAWCELRRNGEPVADVPVDVLLVADRVAPAVQVSPVGRVGKGGFTRPMTDVHGRALIRFKLPEAPLLPRGDVRLKVTFHTPHGDESVAERVPVVGRDIVVEFFPEGGEMVVGVPCRVYVRVTTPGGEPVDLAGDVIDARGEVAARFATARDPNEPAVNRGIGSFVITPQFGSEYWLVRPEPARAAVTGQPLAVAVPGGFRLPQARRDGVAMSVLDLVTSPGQPVRVRLYSVGSERTLVIGAYTRGRLADTRRVKVPAVNPASPKPTDVVLLTGDDGRGGVTRITVFEDPNVDGGDTALPLEPVAERLVFRRPGEFLKLGVAVGAEARPAQPVTDGPTGGVAPFPPNRRTELTFEAKDEKGTPSAAVLFYAVVNAAVVPNPRDRSLTSHFILAGEVQTPDDLEYADFLLTDHPRAAEALDRVLATQGWRRFVEQEAITPRSELAARFRSPRGEADQFLVMNGRYPVSVDPVQARQQRVFETYWPLYDAARRELVAAEAVRETESAKPVPSVPAKERPTETFRDPEPTTLAAPKAPPAPAPAPPSPTPETNTLDGLLASYDASRREAAEVAATIRRWAWLAIAPLAVVALVAAALAFARPNGVRGALPMAVTAIAAGGLAVYLAITAQRAEPGPEPELMPAGTESTTQLPGSTPDSPRTTTAETDQEAPLIGAGVAVAPPPRNVPGNAATDSAKDGSGSLPQPGGADTRASKKVGFAAPATPDSGIPGGGAGAGTAKAMPLIDPKPSLTEPASPPVTPATVPGGAVTPGSAPSPPPLAGMPLGPPKPKGTGSPLPPGMNGFGGRGEPGFAGEEPYARGGGGPGGPRDLYFFEGDRSGSGLIGRSIAPGAILVPNSLLAESAKKDSMRQWSADKADAQFKRWVEERRRLNQQDLERAADRKAAERLREKKALEAFLRKNGMLFGSVENQAADGQSLATSPPAAALQFQPADELARSRVRAAVRQVVPLVVREYAAPRPGSEGWLESADTILWQPVVVLPSEGKITVPLELGNAPAGYRVIVGGHTPDGRIGSARAIIPVGPIEPPPVAGMPPRTAVTPPASPSPPK